MSKELWVEVDCFAHMFYDSKETSNVLKIPKSDQAVVIVLTDSEEKEYEQYLASQEYWQTRFKESYDKHNNIVNYSVL